MSNVRNSFARRVHREIQSCRRLSPDLCQLITAYLGIPLSYRITFPGYEWPTIEPDPTTRFLLIYGEMQRTSEAKIIFFDLREGKILREIRISRETPVCWAWEPSGKMIAIVFGRVLHFYTLFPFQEAVDPSHRLSGLRWTPTQLLGWSEETVHLGSTKQLRTTLYKFDYTPGDLIKVQKGPKITFQEWPQWWTWTDETHLLLLSEDRTLTFMSLEFDRSLFGHQILVEEIEWERVIDCYVNPQGTRLLIVQPSSLTYNPSMSIYEFLQTLVIHTLPTLEQPYFSLEGEKRYVPLFSHSWTGQEGTEFLFRIADSQSPRLTFHPPGVYFSIDFDRIKPEGENFSELSQWRSRRVNLHHTRYGLVVPSFQPELDLVQIDVLATTLDGLFPLELSEIKRGLS